MLLPKQAPPVDRQRTDQRQDDDGGLEPQASCYCREVDGSNTWWCLIGRNFYNTNVTCQP